MESIGISHSASWQRVAWWALVVSGSTLTGQEAKRTCGELDPRKEGGEIKIRRLLSGVLTSVMLITDENCFSPRNWGSQFFFAKLIPPGPTEEVSPTQRGGIQRLQILLSLLVQISSRTPSQLSWECCSPSPAIFLPHIYLKPRQPQKNPGWLPTWESPEGMPRAHSLPSTPPKTWRVSRLESNVAFIACAGTLQPPRLYYIFVC